MKGSLYKVFISPDGSKFYSLKKAVERGFTNEGGDGAEPSGRPRVRKGKTLKKSKSKLLKDAAAKSKSKKNKKG